jgi:signal transduction histidine kinase/ActR/RegA family two-component response regulator
MQNEELQNAHAEAKAAAARYTNLYDFAPVGYFTLNRQGNILQSNLAGSTLLNAERSSLQNKYLCLFVTETDRPIFNSFLEQVFADQSHPTCEVRLESGTGPSVFVQIDAALSVDGQECRAMVKDITEQRKTEARLNDALKLESLGQLAGGVAHEFNNKLQSILGYTEIALDGNCSKEELHTALTAIQQAAFNSADLTRQLLGFARKQIISPEVLDLNATVEDHLKMLRRLIGDNINLVWLPKAQLWPIKMDTSQLQQILTNLSVNARDAIDGTGEIQVKTANVTLEQVPSAETCPPGEYVQLSFSDNGCGMDSETLKHLFEPFFSTKGMCTATGLGSASLYGVIQQNHGFITVDSTLGKGTTFEIYLPRSVNPEAEAKEKIPVPPSKEGYETILLVEDEPVLLSLGQKRLEALGYTVLAADLPDKALSLAEAYCGTIDLLLTDVMMPGMNGHDLATQLQMLRPGLKSVFMSGYTAEILARDKVMPEGVHFILKPFSNQELTTKIRSVLAGQSITEDQNHD